MNTNKIIAADEKLLKKVYLRIPGLGGRKAKYDNYDTTAIKFQFPPLIKSDNKGGDWKEFNARMAEPISLYMGGKPREISLQWTYIVTNEPTNGEKWDVAAVSTYVKKVRGYFYNQAGADLIIYFKAYDIVGSAGGSEYWTFRAESISVDHTSSMILQPDGAAYPLKTDLSMRLKFFTTLNQKAYKKAEDATKSELGEDGDVQKIETLHPLPTSLEWL